MRGKRRGLASIVRAHRGADRDLQRGPTPTHRDVSRARQALGQALGRHPIGFRRKHPVPAGSLLCDNTRRRRDGGRLRLPLTHQGLLDRGCQQRQRARVRGDSCARCRPTRRAAQQREGHRARSAPVDDRSSESMPRRPARAVHRGSRSRRPAHAVARAETRPTRADARRRRRPRAPSVSARTRPDPPRPALLSVRPQSPPRRLSPARDRARAQRDRDHRAHSRGRRGSRRPRQPWCRARSTR